MYSLDPEPPVDLQFVELDENTVYLYWKLPRGDFDIFEVSEASTLTCQIQLHFYI